MRRWLPLVAFGILLCAVSAASQQTFYVVERVVDGDTVALATLGTVRLIGVDTPETVDARRSIQTFGKEATDFLTRVLRGQMVRVEYDGPRKDKYDRTLVYLFLGDGTFVNAEIIKQGYGHTYTQYPFTYLEHFRGFEREARLAKRGLWADAADSSTPAASFVAKSSIDAAPTAKTLSVYVTRTGEKYHVSGCRYLARSQIPMALKEAAARYGPCSVCRPPIR